MSELMNCPFCGSDELIRMKKCISCDNCGAESGYVDDYLMDGAVEALWNSRVELGKWGYISDCPSDRITIYTIMDGIVQTARECAPEEGIRKRWFCGDVSGAYPIDELEFYMPIILPPAPVEAALNQQAERI